MRSYYTSLRVHRRTWKPLFHFLIDTIVTNCYKLSSFATPGWPHKAGHKDFMVDLVNALFEHSVRPANTSETCLSMSQIVPQTPINHGYKPVIINRVDKTCSACAEAGRRNTIIRSSGRKPLHKLSHNSVVRRGKDLECLKRTPCTRFGCRLCRIPLCQSGLC